MVARTGTIIKIKVAARCRQVQCTFHIHIGMALRFTILDLGSK